MTPSNDFWKSTVKKSAGLDVTDRILEVLFGLIMVLSFTLTINYTTGGIEQVSELLWGALGCNFAWGVIDAVFYLINAAILRSHAFKTIKQIEKLNNVAEARGKIRDNIPPFISGIMTDTEIDNLAKKINQLPVPEFKNIFSGKDFLTAIQIFFLVFLSTFPVALPFIFISEVPMALRVSNYVALASMFIGGWLLARYGGLRPILTALLFTAIGVALVYFTIALGG